MSARNLTVIDDVYMMNSSNYSYFYNSILWGGITSPSYWLFQPNNTIVKGGNGSWNLQGNFDVTSLNADGSDIFADPTSAIPDYTLKACAIAVNVESRTMTAPSSRYYNFFRAITLSLTNPKAILFFLSFFIQFVEPTYAHPLLSN